VVLQAPAPPSELPSVGFILAAILGSLPIIGIFVWGGVRVLGPITQALARRIGGRTEGAEELHAEVSELQQQMHQLREQLGEMQERMDFAERLLAQRREPERLGGR